MRNGRKTSSCAKQHSVPVGNIYLDVRGMNASNAVITDDMGIVDHGCKLWPGQTGVWQAWLVDRNHEVIAEDAKIKSMTDSWNLSVED